MSASVVVSAPPAGWKCPPGHVVISRPTDVLGEDDRAVVKALVVTVDRRQAAMALSLAAEVHAGMSVAEIATAILGVYDEGKGDVVARGAAIGQAADQRAAAEVPATREERRWYRYWWPSNPRTQLCAQLAERLVSAVERGSVVVPAPAAPPVIERSGRAGVLVAGGVR